MGEIIYKNTSTLLKVGISPDFSKNSQVFLTIKVACALRLLLKALKWEDRKNNNKLENADLAWNNLFC